MVVEANRDAARECVLKAKEALKRDDLQKMKNLLARAKKLDPDCNVNEILSNGYSFDEESDRSYAHDDHYDSTNDLNNLKNRKNSAKKTSQNDNSQKVKEQPSTSSSHRSKSRSKSAGRNSKTNETEYTKEDYEIVQRIRHCKDYYEILQVKRDSTVTHLKKKYYELALKLHPDKCKVPGSTEAFKALGNAYGVLSDNKKREEYDRYGPESERSNARSHRSHGDFYEYDVGRGFESEMSPEDIFEMFFGGGFSRGTMNQRRRTNLFTQSREENHQREETSPFFQLVQILPILVILFGGLIMQFLVGEPLYSLNRDSTYYLQRFTKDLRVPYYVKPDFEKNYGNNLRQVEQRVEDDYLTLLRSNCYREKNHRESLLWTAKLRGDNEMWRRAQETELTYCRKLEELYH